MHILYYKGTLLRIIGLAVDENSLQNVQRRRAKRN